jgi:hypothetical protein
LPDGSDSTKSQSGEKKDAWNAEGDGCWPVIRYHLFKKLHMFNLCQQLFHADMCEHSFQSSPPIWTIRAFLSSDSLMFSWNVIRSVPHTLDLSLVILIRAWLLK